MNFHIDINLFHNKKMNINNNIDLFYNNIKK